MTDFVQGNGHIFQNSTAAPGDGHPGLQSSVQRPSYIVVTLVTCALVFIGFGVKLLKPYVPKSANIFASSREEFLLQGAAEGIRWYPNNELAFVEARRTGKPILLEIGCPWSRLGRQLDEDAFQDDAVVDLLSRDFICVRVDGMRHPDWLNALMPVGRLTNRFSVGCQLWVLDPAGHVVEVIGQTASDQAFDHSSVLNILLGVRNRYSSIELDSGKESEEVGVLQRQDLDRLKSTSTIALPDLDGFQQALDESIDPTYGGFPKSGIQSIQPEAWSFQLLSGDTENLKRSLVPILESPLDDALDGGFYRASRSLDCRQVEFDKLTCRNAEMLLLLAQAGALLSDPGLSYASKRTWNYLANEVYRDRIFATCRVGDELTDGRSEHSSFSPSRLRAILKSDDRNWAIQNLGLNVAVNPLMTPYPTSLSLLGKDRETFDRIVEALRRAGGPSAKVSGLGQLDTNAFTAARMLETARIWQDRESLNFALDAVDALGRFEDGASFVLPDLYDVTPQPTLPDYLSYADAQLQDYLATGRVVALDKGLARLQQGLESFGTDISGAYRLGPSGTSANAVQDIEVPEIADNVRESCTAQIIRLSLEYGRLLGDTAKGRDLQHRAFTAMSRFAGVTGSFSPTAGGYFTASLLGQDDRYAIAVGPHAQQLSDQLFSKVPTRFVAPAFGKIRRDLQRRAPGIYILRGPDVYGPLTVAQAAETLPCFYSLAPLPVDIRHTSVP